MTKSGSPELRLLAVLLMSCVLPLLVPSRASAQASITGIVSDTSGAVLPGVTVEASSPALIEKVRSVVTDGAGQYRIVDLRPGIYTVTFSLSGFAGVRREGIELSGTFTASVNVEMKVGEVAETITVSGQSPIVDTQSATREQVLNRELVDALPTARTPNGLATLIPGVTSVAPGGRSSQDSGGSRFDLPLLSAHGSRPEDQRILIDGLSQRNGGTGGAYTGSLPDAGATQEVVVLITGGTAERSTGGVYVNYIPREGGNSLSASGTFAYADSSWQSSNLTQYLRDRGLTSADFKIKQNYDYNPSVGGPIVPNRLWFYASARWNGADNYVGGMYANKNAGNPAAWTYVPDLSNPSFLSSKQRSANVRLTAQLTPRHKIAFFIDDQTRCLCPWTLSPVVAPEAARSLDYFLNRLTAVTWSAPVSDRLLFDAAVSRRIEKYDYQHPSIDDPRRAMIGVTDDATGLQYRSVFDPWLAYTSPLKQFRASMSYVTGTHAFKVGAANETVAYEGEVIDNLENVSYRFFNGRPTTVQMRAQTLGTDRLTWDLGVFAQDRWTLGRLTANLGVRFSYSANAYDETHLGPTVFIPERDITIPQEDFSSRYDFDPRLGFAYDLFGNGRTALKGSLNRYEIAATPGFATGQGIGTANKASQIASNITRSWDDANQNYTPDCDLTNLLANGECGRASNLAFGQPVQTVTVDPALTHGWYKRPYNWEMSAGVQQELASWISVDAAYFRRWYGNFYALDNLPVGVADYDRFSVVAPVNPDLPSSGSVVDGLYNLSPSKVGLINQVLTLASNYGKQIEHWNGVDLTVSARSLFNVRLAGGLSTGRTSTNTCEIRAKLPEIAAVNPFCDVDGKFRSQFKLLGSYEVPRVDIQVSGSWQSLPGPEVLANVSYTSAEVEPTLGRPLSGGAARVTVPVLKPGTMYGDRSNLVDLRVAKVFRVGGGRVTPSLDVYNLLNSDAVISENANYAAWRRPLQTAVARFAKVNVQVAF